jgi:hypothetical protein
LFFDSFGVISYGFSTDFFSINISFDFSIIGFSIIDFFIVGLLSIYYFSGYFSSFSSIGFALFSSVGFVSFLGFSFIVFVSFTLSSLGIVFLFSSFFFSFYPYYGFSLITSAFISFPLTTPFSFSFTTLPVTAVTAGAYSFLTPFGSSCL